MREKIVINAFCIYIICFFCFLLILICNKSNSGIPVVSTVDNDFVIVIDAGHGGSDGGAVGVDGTNEAKLNLEIANTLNNYLRTVGFNTFMTRTDENSIGESGTSIRNEKVSDIHKRMDLMNSFDNCLFISIHQNYYQGSSSWGTQVFYSANNSQSELLAESIQSSVIELIQSDNKRAIKKAGSSIYLLDKAVKPAVLVECGFISNSNDLNKLKDDDYQRQLVFCILNGIVDYMKEEGAFYGF